MTASYFNHISEIYGKSVFKIEDLKEILSICGLEWKEARQIMIDAFNDKQIGRIEYRQGRRKLPRKGTLVYIKENRKRHSP